MSGAQDGPVTVDLSIACDAWPQACLEAGSLAEAAALAALRDVALPAAGLVVVGLVLTGDAEQRELNRTWRGKDAATNVLAFSTADLAAPLPPGAPLLLGDVVLAFETVAREAAEQGKAFSHHLCHLVVHGVLHLLGFDHGTDAEAALMEAREVAILAGLGVPAPYEATI